MSTYPEIDKLFGPAVAMTVEGKMQNTSSGWYIAGGVVILVAIVGVIAIKKGFRNSHPDVPGKKEHPSVT